MVEKNLNNLKMVLKCTLKLKKAINSLLKENIPHP